ncbi:MAG: chemotaxis protein CheW [Nitrospiraceae bacterium]|nr:chemotaxis protein CheW [Nitrospiraceae bacterium]
MDLAKIRKKLREARQKAAEGAGGTAEKSSEESGISDAQSGHGAVDPEAFSGQGREVNARPVEINAPEEPAAHAGHEDQASLQSQPQTQPSANNASDGFETLSLDELAAESHAVNQSVSGEQSLSTEGETAAAIKEQARQDSSGRQEGQQPVASEQTGPSEAKQTAGAEQDEAEQEKEKEKTRQKNIELLTFKLSGEDYAFRIEDIEEILKPQQVTKVPRVVAYISGVSSLRGKIIPVMDLKTRLGLKGESVSGKYSRVLILRGPKGSIGVSVDMVEDVLRIPAASVQEPPAHLSEIEVKYLEGVALVDGSFISVMKTGEVLSVKDAV